MLQGVKDSHLEATSLFIVFSSMQLLCSFTMWLHNNKGLVNKNKPMYSR
jgi:hypothetical protein